MSRLLKRTRDSLVHSHPYRIATVLATIGLIALLVAGLTLFLPAADAASIQAALAIVAEIAGVLLGAVLVATVLLIEQRHRAKELLRSASQKYRTLIESRIGVIDAVRTTLLEAARAREIRLDEQVASPLSDPSVTDYSDAIAKLSALVSAFSERVDSWDLDGAKKDLLGLGYSKEDVDSILVSSAIDAQIDPDAFFRLLDGALDVCVSPPLNTQQTADLWLEVLPQYGRDGVLSALSTLKRTDDLLSSKTLVAGVIAPTLTAVLAILTVIGTAGDSILDWQHVLAVLFTFVGFTLSVVLALRLVGSMLD
jgi:hypothetical protein